MSENHGRLEAAMPPAARGCGETQSAPGGDIIIVDGESEEPPAIGWGFFFLGGGGRI